MYDNRKYISYNIFPCLFLSPSSHLFSSDGDWMQWTMTAAAVAEEDSGGSAYGERAAAKKRVALRGGLRG